MLFYNQFKGTSDLDGDAYSGSRNHTPHFKAYSVKPIAGRKKHG